MLEALVGCTAIALFAWKAKILSAKASFLAFVFGSTIWAMNGPAWIFILITFLVSGYIGTKWRFEAKKKMGMEESSNGSRGTRNILGNGLAPVLFGLLGNPVAFVGSVSTAMADTLASEIGVFSERTRLITTWKRVEPGTDGAVSPLGTLLSALGSAFISLLGYFFIGINPLYAFLGGFIGCQVDSVLGATLERRGYLSKSGVNLIATLSGGLIAAAFLII